MSQYAPDINRAFQRRLQDTEKRLNRLEMALSTKVSTTATQERDYTPDWTATGTAPSIGNGTISGSYAYIGNTHVLLSVYAAFGTTTTYGTGTWSFGVPSGVTIKYQTSDVPKTGASYMYDSSGTLYSVGIVYPASGTTLRSIIHATTAPIGATTPVVWANGDTITFTILAERG